MVGVTFVRVLANLRGEEAVRLRAMQQECDEYGALKPHHNERIARYASDNKERIAHRQERRIRQETR